MSRRLPGEYPTKPEGISPIAGRPRMPKFLSPIAAEKWREMLRLLKAQGVLSKADGPALEIYCESYARWRALLDELEREGHMVEHTVLTSNGTPITKRIVNPAVKAAAQLENSMRQMLGQLGSTPVTRGRAKPAKENPSEAPLPPDSAGAMAGSVFDQLESGAHEDELRSDFTADVGAEETDGAKVRGDE